jgi:hypothetical protein
VLVRWEKCVGFQERGYKKRMLWQKHYYGIYQYWTLPEIVFGSWFYSHVQVIAVMLATNYLKKGIEPTPKISCISNIPQTIPNIIMV